MKDEVDFDYEDHEDKFGFDSEKGTEQAFACTPFQVKSNISCKGSLNLRYFNDDSLTRCVLDCWVVKCDL